jgi:hypothetical protein
MPFVIATAEERFEKLGKYTGYLQADAAPGYDSRSCCDKQALGTDVSRRNPAPRIAKMNCPNSRYVPRNRKK